MTELSTHKAPSPPLDARAIWHLALTGLALTLAFAAVMLALRSNADRQVTFASHERVFVEPGGRLIYYPQRREAIIKGWLMSSLSPAQVYQVWAVEDGKARALATARPSDFREINLFLHDDLSRAERVIVTIEPAPGSAGPTTPPVVELVR